MQYQELGNTGTSVSRLCLGTMTFGDVLQHVASRHKATVAQVALGWQLHQGFVTSVIIGAKNQKQLEDDLGAASLKLTSDDLAEIDAVSKPSEICPEWVFDLHRGDRIPGGSGNYSDLMKSICRLPQHVWDPE